MNSDIHSVAYGSEMIDFELRRSSRKTLAIHVHPDMRVEVIAPQTAQIDNVYQKVKKRVKWVKTQQIFFEQFHPKTPPRQYVSGENHYYLGRQLRLKVTRDIATSVKMSGGHIVVTSPYLNNPKVTRELTEGWFKDRAHQKFQERLALCIEKFPVPKNFEPQGLIIRKLTNRWGSMTAANRLVLNTKLIHAPLECIDYVIIHELCHIAHPNHGPKFWKLLGVIFPDWQKRKSQLEKYFVGG